MKIFFLSVTSIAVQFLWVTAFEAANDFDRLSISLGPCLLDLEDPCNSGKVLFYLYTRGSADNAANITVRDKELPPGYDVSAPTKVLIHGYAGSVDYNGTIIVRKAYQRHGKYNVIVVDWGALVKLPCYPTATLNTIQAGKCTARVLANLASLTKSNVAKFHIVGFSLGAHVASFASNELERTRREKVGRITGLDPALPFFASLSSSWKLDKEDAHFVDIIHTNIGIFGKIEPTGHVDFYVNDGFSQPACYQSHNVPLCSHTIALRYYAESITARDDRGFWGTPCGSYLDHVFGWCEGSGANQIQALMGERCKESTRGVYYVPTAAEPPFALGMAH